MGHQSSKSQGSPGQRNKKPSPKTNENKNKNNNFGNINTSKKKSTPTANENKNKSSSSGGGGKDKKEPQKIGNIGNIGNTGSGANQKNINKIVQDMLRHGGRKTDLFGNEISYVNDLRNAGYSSKDIADMQKNASRATSAGAKSSARKFLGKLGETLNTPVSQRGLSETALKNLNSPVNLGGRSFASSDLTNPFYMNNITRGFDQAGNKINIDPDVGKSFNIDRGQSPLVKYGMMAGVNAIAPGLGFAPAIFDKMFGSSDYQQRMQFFKEQGLTGDALKNATMASLQEPLGTGIENLEGFQSQLNQNKMLNKFDTNGFQNVFQDFNRDPQVTQTQEGGGGNDGGGSGSTTQQPFDSTNMMTYFDPNQGKYVSGTFQDYQKVVQVKDGGIIGLAEGGPAEEISIPDLNSFRTGQVMSNPGGMPYMNPETGEMFSSQDLREDLDDANRLLPDSGIAKLLQRLQTEGDIAAGNNEADQFLRTGSAIFYNRNTRQKELHYMDNPESKRLFDLGILERIDETLPEEQQMFGPSLEAGYRNMEDVIIPKAPNRMSSEPGITSIPGADRVIEGTTMEDVNIPSDMRPGMETNDPMLMFPENPNSQEMLFASEPQQAGEGIGSIIIDAIRRSVENGSMTPRQGEIAIQNMLESMGPKQIDLFTGARGGIASLASGGMGLDAMGNRQDIEAAESLMFKDPEQDQEWEYNI